MRVTGGLRRAWTGAVTGAALCCAAASSEAAAPAAGRDRIRLIARADDMGACHTVNEACVRHLGGWSGAERSAEEKTRALVALLEGLAGGDWLIIEHPGADTPEMRALGHPGYENVAADRAGVTAAFRSDAVRAVIERRGIELISYRDLVGR